MGVDLTKFVDYVNLISLKTKRDLRVINFLHKLINHAIYCHYFLLKFSFWTLHQDNCVFLYTNNQHTPTCSMICFIYIFVLLLGFLCWINKLFIYFSNFITPFCFFFWYIRNLYSKNSVKININQITNMRTMINNFKMLPLNLKLLVYVCA